MTDPYLFWSSVGQSIVILITGLFAFIIYKKSKKDNLRDIARIVAMEVLQAEQAIREIQKGGAVSKLTSIMPQFSWQKNKYLFVRHLNDNDLQRIDRFYTLCLELENTLQRLKDVLPDAISAKSKFIQQALVNLAASNESGFDYQERKRRFLDILHNENYYFDPTQVKTDMANFILQVKDISGTTSFEKIRQLAGL